MLPQKYQILGPKLTLTDEVVGRNAPGVTKALAIPREATATAAVTFIVTSSMRK